VLPESRQGRPPDPATVALAQWGRDCGCERRTLALDRLGLMVALLFLKSISDSRPRGSARNRAARMTICCNGPAPVRQSKRLGPGPDSDSQRASRRWRPWLPPWRKDGRGPSPVGRPTGLILRPRSVRPWLAATVCWRRLKLAYEAKTLGGPSLGCARLAAPGRSARAARNCITNSIGRAWSVPERTVTRCRAIGGGGPG